MSKLLHLPLVIDPLEYEPGRCYARRTRTVYLTMLCGELPGSIRNQQRLEERELAND